MVIGTRLKALLQHFVPLPAVSATGYIMQAFAMIVKVRTVI
jgi:hypothetical protein